MVWCGVVWCGMHRGESRDSTGLGRGEWGPRALTIQRLGAYRGTQRNTMRNGIEEGREGGRGDREGVWDCPRWDRHWEVKRIMRTGEEFEVEAKKKRKAPAQAHATRERQQASSSRSPLGMASGDSQAPPLASSIARLWLGTRITPKVRSTLYWTARWITPIYSVLRT